MEAGHVLRAYQRLARRTGWAVLVLHHTTKVGDEARGSTAITALADIILTLHRENEHPQRRRLEGRSRYQATPESLLIELRDGQYVLLGTPDEVSAQERTVRVLEALPAEGEGLTQAEVATATGLPQQRVAEIGRASCRERV